MTSSTKAEFEELLAKERKHWKLIDDLLEKIKKVNCPELEAHFRRLSFQLRQVKNTDDYEYYWSEVCSETGQLLINTGK